MKRIHIGKKSMTIIKGFASSSGMKRASEKLRAAKIEHFAMTDYSAPASKRYVIVVSRADTLAAIQVLATRSKIS